jgi:hypothetical protein
VNDDTYSVKGGKRAINKVGLSKLADLAQIEHVDTDWDYMGGAGIRATVSARMRGSDGVWRTCKETKQVDYALLKEQVRLRLIKNGVKDPTEEAVLTSYVAEREFLPEKTESRAFLRAIRTLIAVKPAYTAQELQKPFFVIGWAFTPDWSNPNVNRMLELNFREATADLYGADTAPAELPPEVERPVQRPPEPQPEPTPVQQPPPPEPEPEEEVHDAQVVEPEEPDPEELDWDDEPEVAEEAVKEAEVVPEPEAKPSKIEQPGDLFTFKNGPFADKSVAEVVQMEEGRAWLAAVWMKAAGEKKDQARAWLCWAEQKELDDEEIKDIAIPF